KRTYVIQMSHEQMVRRPPSYSKAQTTHNLQGAKTEVSRKGAKAQRALLRAIPFPLRLCVINKKAKQ
ncbi:MAG: hypothetical protein QGF59_15195, partial [Pirellulaceae bacterium]|nr:hypothetical protein [Pirellulaceae bacterium]